MHLVVFEDGEHRYFSTMAFPTGDQGHLRRILKNKSHTSSMESAYHFSESCTLSFGQFVLRHGEQVPDISSHFPRPLSLRLKLIMIRIAINPPLIPMISRMPVSLISTMIRSCPKLRLRNLAVIRLGSVFGLQQFHC